MVNLWRVKLSGFQLTWYLVEPYVLLMMCVDLRSSYVDSALICVYWYVFKFAALICIDWCWFCVALCLLLLMLRWFVLLCGNMYSLVLICAELSCNWVECIDLCRLMLICSSSWFCVDFMLWCRMDIELCCVVLC